MKRRAYPICIALLPKCVDPYCPANQVEGRSLVRTENRLVLVIVLVLRKEFEVLEPECLILLISLSHAHTVAT